MQANQPKRKVIQLVAAPLEDGYRLYALCSDGTIWRLSSKGDWEKFYTPPEEDDSN